MALRPIPSISLAIALYIFAPAGTALAAESAYSKIGEKTCKWDQQTKEEEEDGLFNCGTCAGYRDYTLRLCDGDLRQSIHYGPGFEEDEGWHSFSQFNHAGPTVEWRVTNGVPIAAIHRFFVENSDDNGDITPERQGQVLVISKVAQPGDPLSCPVGYVDARANPNANELAQKIADEVAPGFQCGETKPQFYGVRGPYAGNPTDIEE